jgi:hypothetical protein
MDEKAKMNQYVFRHSFVLHLKGCGFFLKLPPDEDVKRRQRRDRNKQAAAKCRRKRNDLREELEKVCYLIINSFFSIQLFRRNRLNKYYWMNKNLSNVRFKI